MMVEMAVPNTAKTMMEPRFWKKLPCGEKRERERERHLRNLLLMVMKWGNPTLYSLKDFTQKNNSNLLQVAAVLLCHEALQHKCTCIAAVRYHAGMAVLRGKISKNCVSYSIKLIHRSL